MSADPAPLARAYAYAYADVYASAHRHARAPRSRIALALTIGLHLLAAWLWLQQRLPRPPAAAEPPGVVTILLRPRDTAPTPASPPEPQRPSTAAHAGVAPPAVRQPDLPALYVPPLAPASSSSIMPATPADTPITAAPASAEASAADAAPTPAPGAGANAGAAAPASADGGFTASLGRRQAGRVDRELRAGKSGVPAQADTPWARFERGVDAAHVESSLSAQLDSYTSPDGVVIYRRRVGSRTSCYQTGSVGLGSAGTRTSGNAGNVACPSGVTWKREE